MPVELISLSGVPLVKPGDNIASILKDVLRLNGVTLQPCDILVIASKVFAVSEDRFVDLSTVQVSTEAQSLAEQVDKDPRLVEVILQDSQRVSRHKPGALIVRHRLGFISANAAVDQSNSVPPYANKESGPWVLRMPENPDHCAQHVHQALQRDDSTPLGIIVTDSLGRPFRYGAMGSVVGLAGVPGLVEQHGKHDLFGRELQATTSAFADAIAGLADLIAGQADEQSPFTLVRGLQFTSSDAKATDLIRDPERDLYA